MSPLARSLLALAAAALLHGACASPKEVGDAQCTTVMHGSAEGAPVNLAVVFIPEGNQSASVEIPNPCKSYPALGEQVTACDDVPPTVQLPALPDDSPAIIYRRGNFYQQDAPVSVTFWCYR